MSEENITDAESETPEVSSAENFINAITAKDFVSASKEFEDMMMAKVDDTLEQEKINMAGQVFNDEEPSEDDDTEEVGDDDTEEVGDDDTEEVEEYDEEDDEDEEDIRPS